MDDDTLIDEIAAFLDANIILEGRPVEELPWDEISSDGRIRVLIVPKAMEEIDAKKRDGRLGQVARTFNRLLSSFIIDGIPVVIRDSNPRVEIEVATCSRIPWNEYDELDPEDGDSRIVAEALNALNIKSRRRMLISHDIKPLLYARGRGIPIYKASDDWLRAPEPSPKDKELQRLKQQLAEYKKDEPKFDVSIEVLDFDTHEFIEFENLTELQSQELLKSIRKMNPKKSNGRCDPYGINIGLDLDWDPSYDDKYDNYISKSVPDFIEKFTEKMEVAVNQRIINVSVINCGDIRADHLVISIKSRGGWINDKIIFVHPGGPAAAFHRRSVFMGPNIKNSILQAIPPRIGRHEFETTRRANRGHEMEVSCEDFRSGQEYKFSGILVPSIDSNPLEVSVSITAKNMRGEKSKQVKFEKNFTISQIGDFIDFEQLRFIKSYPVSERTKQIFSNNDKRMIEVDGESDD